MGENGLKSEVERILLHEGGFGWAMGWHVMRFWAGT